MPSLYKKWRLERTAGFAPVINLLIVTGCVCGFSLSLSAASGLGSVSSQRRARRGRAFGQRGDGASQNRPLGAALFAKGDRPLFPLSDEPVSLAFVGGLRNGILRAAGLGDLLPGTVEDDASWGKQIVNTTNIQKGNITRDAVVETWSKVLGGEDVGDAADHIWRDFLGDWSAVRRNKLLMAGVRAVCVAVLTWGFCESVMTSVTVSGIRMWTAMRQRSFIMKWHSFLRIDPAHRAVILNTYGILKVRFEALFFALKALGTLIVVPYYESLVCTIEGVCFSKEYRKKYPLVSRLQGLIMSVLVGWLFARVIGVAGVLLCTILGLSKVWIVTKLNPL